MTVNLILTGFLSLFVGIAAGFVFGGKKKKVREKPKNAIIKSSESILNEEYRNFLNYDGSEQA